ncbi:MAG: DEAD/DEAH box helicase [Saprospirales bacterium]|nr:DEAD/DEAH box helicase [Saprospirales bacterium]
MRKSYGNTWWGEQWLHALHHIDYSNRLPRGRTYANKGAVRDIQIEENTISAKVQGTRPRPYKVQLEIPVFTANEKARIIQAVTANPLFLSKLLNRELPPELYQACVDQGIRIFPRSWNDLDGHCSCPDWAVPCKHMAAVLYLVANEIDKNPFLAFELHDFDLFQGLAGVGYTSNGQKGVSIPLFSGLIQPYQIWPDTQVWDDGVFSDIDFSKLPDCRDQLLRVLAPNAVFYPEGDFGKTLRSVYSKVAKSITAEVQEDWDLKLEQTEKIEIVLNHHLEFLQCDCTDEKGDPCISFRELDDLVAWLRQAPLGRMEHLSEEMRGLILTFRLAEKLAEKSAYIPQLLELEKGQFLIRWLPAYLQEDVWEIADLVEMLTPTTLLSYQFYQKRWSPTEEDAFPALVSLFINYFVQKGHDLWDVDPMLSLFFTGKVTRFDHFETREHPSAIQLWLNRLYITDKHYVPVILVEDLDGAFRVQIVIEDKTQSLEAPISLRDLFADDTHKAIRLEALRDLSHLSDYFPQISLLTASKGKEDLIFNPKEFVDILLNILPTIRLFGIKVLLPKALRKLIRPQLSMQLKGSDNGTATASSFLSLENMLRFQWQVALGDQLLSPEEFLEQVKKLSGIVKLHDQFVYFDENEVKALINKLDAPPTLSGPQLLQAALTEEYQGAFVKLDRKAQQILQDLLRGEGMALPKGLEATLRPYQIRGYEWLYKNARLGFGSLIADDMGLGKTLQVIATLLQLKESNELGEKKALVIVPTTLLTNWDKEIRRFAPGLQTHIYHGPGRSLQPLKEADVLLTTYGVARSETATLHKKPWLVVVVDEAQNIKNPKTEQTKAIKKIEAPVRIAMSGTPVENRLSEYWSIMDFTNKGYLGNLNHFKEEFARPIEVDRDHRQLERFRRVTEPFILRRLKSDKSIIPDLPDKIEQNQYCQLTSEQTALYQSVLDNTLEAIEQSDGINRQGLVLKLITALKQVCNHPVHFLKTGVATPTLSGKATLLIDLLRQILEGDEKTLIFTQYQEMGQLLVQMLKAEFGVETPFLHGGVSRKGRDEMVENFQHNRTTRLMLLSLKAGGTGLNLTAASNVIHYDLWWNPAVENQATDRAYRIGQHRNVLVHRFITQSTFEEKIDKLLQHKKELADLTVSSGEKWIGDLSNEELKRLVVLE